MKRWLLCCAGLLFASNAYGQLIPPDRVTTWKPGLTYNGGIPSPTNVIATLSPSGADDTVAIQNALNGCGRNQVVLLAAGDFKITDPGLHFSNYDVNNPSLNNSGCVLRGSGTGTWMTGVGGTRLVGNFVNSTAVISIGNNSKTHDVGSINLTADAVKGTNMATLASTAGLYVGQIVLIDINTDNHPDVHWGFAHDPPGPGSRCWFDRCDRSLSQLVKITAINGNQITIDEPLHITFAVQYQAQVTPFWNGDGTGELPFMDHIGIENLTALNGQNDNIAISNCDSCWVRNVNSYNAYGSAVDIAYSLRWEVRDSLLHKELQPWPGGQGYVFGLAFSATSGLLENNQLGYGDKVIVARATGGGNVVGYNYFDDAFIIDSPQSPEAGMNMGHFTTPHFELMEGNQSHQYKADGFWGNAIYLTVFRNWLTAHRGGQDWGTGSPLSQYTYFSDPLKGGDGCTYRYGDFWNHEAVSVQAYSFYTNFVGNILGMSGQQPLNYNDGCWVATQNPGIYENLDNFAPDNGIYMYDVGEDQSAQAVPPGNSVWVPSTYATQLRQGNWDFVTNGQIWYTAIGGRGTTGGGTPQAIPNSLYLGAKPPFFAAADQWPWTNPSTGAVYTLPAKWCFDHQLMPTCRAST